MAKIKNLYEDKNGNFFTRVVIPKDVAEILGQREFKKSHGTKNRLIALQRHEVCEALFKRQIDTARLELESEAKITHALLNTITHVWKERKAAEIQRGGIFAEQYLQIVNGCYEAMDSPIGELIDDLSRAPVNDSDALYLQLNSVLGDELKAALESAELPLRELGTHHKQLLLAFGKAHIQLCRLALHVKSAQLTATSIGVIPHAAPAPIAPPSKTTKTFEEVAAECLETAVRRGEITSDQTKQAYSTSISRFLQLYPNKSIEDFSKADFAEFRKVLEQLPSNAKKDVKCQPILKQVEIAKKQGLKTLSQGSVRREIMAISKVFTFAVDSGYIEISPATRGSVGIKRGDAIADDDKTYSQDEVKRIFTSEIYADKRKAEKSRYGLAAYWLPLMLYYTGARAEEIAQLYVADIKFNPNGVSSIMVTNERDDQSTKDGKRREIPIHSHLIELGFAEYVATLPTNSRLFPNLEADTYGKYNTKIGQWLGKYIREKVGINRKGLKPLHGLRHCFKTICRMMDVREDVEDAITGHSAKTVGRRYGVYTLDMKSEVIEKVPRCI